MLQSEAKSTLCAPLSGAEKTKKEVFLMGSANIDDFIASDPQVSKW